MTAQHTGVRPWPGEVVELDGGLRVHVRHATSPAAGSTAVFVHGLGGSSLNWTELMAALHGEVDSWAPDLPGYGESLPAPDGDHGIDGLGRAVELVVERLAEGAGGPVHVVGNSMGGLLTVLLAARRPDLVRTLALLSPALPPRRLPRDARFIALLAIPRLGELALARHGRRSVEAQAALSLATIYEDPSRLPPERVAQAVRERQRRLEQPYANEVFLGSLRSLVGLGVRPRHGVWARAGRVAAPTLVVYGGRDRLVHRAAANRWQRIMPSARLALLPSCGHVPQMERPTLVARLLREHWSS